MPITPADIALGFLLMCGWALFEEAARHLARKIRDRRRPPADRAKLIENLEETLELLRREDRP
jgi:hypothetical protein